MPTEYSKLLAIINSRAYYDDTHLAPYIGYEFEVIKKGKRKSKVKWWFKHISIDNKYLNFVYANNVGGLE